LIWFGLYWFLLLFVANADWGARNGVGRAAKNVERCRVAKTGR
jgi:hypothetical protein